MVNKAKGKMMADNFVHAYVKLYVCTVVWEFLYNFDSCVHHAEKDVTLRTSFYP